LVAVLANFPAVSEPERSKEAFMALTEKIDPFGATKRVGSLLDEFKAFAFKGNVVDLAVGVIIGAAFGAIIKSLVDNIIMPLISVVLPGEHGYEDWHFTLNGVTVPFGKFLAEILNFLIVAAVLFLFIKKFLGLVMTAKKEDPPPPTKDQILLTEIRDLLKANQAAKTTTGDSN
jgi:large conductance mechanosensitive channel